jgi:hypothetical protein
LVQLDLREKRVPRELLVLRVLRVFREKQAHLVVLLGRKGQPVLRVSKVPQELLEQPERPGLRELLE